MRRRPSVLEWIVLVQILVVGFLVGDYYVWMRTKPGWIMALHSDDAQTRSRAAQQLGEGGEENAQAIPALVQLLEDPDNSVGSSAAQALRRIGGVPALIQACKSPNPVVRMRSIQALTYSNPEDPATLDQRVTMFAEALKDPDPRVRTFAANALRAAGQAGAQAAPALIEALDDPDPYVRQGAVEALGAMKSLEGLRQALDSPDWSVRIRAIGQLHGFGPEAVPAIIHALDDRNGSIVSQAADMLSQMAPNDPRTLPALIRALTHPDTQARASAVTALERLGPQALPALRDAMTDSNPSVARMAREAVSRLERRAGN